MTEKGSRKIYVNLVVRNLNKSVNFFSSLGFEFNSKFSNENAACMIISDQAFIMLLTEPFFRSFSRRDPCDTTKFTEALLAISCDSRAEVDTLVGQAIASGGNHAADPQDQGFMYEWSFYDLDGHHWEVIWMDPTAAQ